MIREAAAAMFAGLPLPHGLEGRPAVVMLALSKVRAQLRIAPLGGVLGLDFPACECILRPLGMWREEIVEGLLAADDAVRKAFPVKPGAVSEPKSRDLPGGGRLLRF